MWILLAQLQSLLNPRHTQARDASEYMKVSYLSNINLFSLILEDTLTFLYYKNTPEDNYLSSLQCIVQKKFCKITFVWILCLKYKLLLINLSVDKKGDGQNCNVIFQQYFSPKVWVKHDREKKENHR